MPASEFGCSPSFGGHRASQRATPIYAMILLRINPLFDRRISGLKRGSGEAWIAAALQTSATSPQGGDLKSLEFSWLRSIAVRRQQTRTKQGAVLCSGRVRDTHFNMQARSS